MAQQLESGAARVVHHEEGNPIGSAEVARADELAVALEIGEADQMRSQHLDEPRGAAAVLDIRPAGLADGCQVEAVARGDEARFVRRKRVGLGCMLHDLVLPEVFVLGLLHGGREHELQVYVGHGLIFRGAHVNAERDAQVRKCRVRLRRAGSSSWSDLDKCQQLLSR